MSVREYQWKAVTHNDLDKAVKWSQNKLNLRDWLITLLTGCDVPEEFDKEDVGTNLGWSSTNPKLLKAIIWIPLDRNEVDGENAIQTLFHEMVHVFDYARLGLNAEQTEIHAYMFEYILFELYCRENKIKLPDFS